MTKVLVTLALLFLANNAYAARGFGATKGISSTDIMDTGFSTTTTTTRSYSIWVWITGSGGSGFGQAINFKSGATYYEYVSMNGSTASMQYVRHWSTGDGGWGWTAPATNGWHNIVLTYDATSTSNNPVVYVDGSSVSVTRNTGPSGTIATATGTFKLGNEPGASLGWNGELAEFAIWDGTILSANEAKALSRGVSPLRIRRSLLSYYAPLYGFQSNEMDWGPSHLAATLTGTKFQPHAPVQPFPFS